MGRAAMPTPHTDTDLDLAGHSVAVLLHRRGTHRAHKDVVQA